MSNQDVQKTDKNTYVKYCPNVYVAKCPNKHEKGAEIIVTTRRGKENECIVHNLMYEKNGYYFYSITRADGFDSREFAKKKAERFQTFADNAQSRGDEWFEKSNEGAEFLKLAEPIKVGHHSEKRHRALIERNTNRMRNAMNEYKKIQSYEHKAEYWKNQANKTDLSMPQSIEYFEFKLEAARKKHEGLKNGTIPREHTYDIAYARKAVRDLEHKLKIAKKLWE